MFVASTAPLITNAGSGYIEQPTVTFSGGGGSGASAYATVGSGTVIRALGSTGTQALDIYTAAGINTAVPNFRFRDATGDSYWTSSNQAATAVLTSSGNTNANAFIIANGTGFVSLRTGGGNQLEQMRVGNTTSAVNYVQVTGAVTTGSPTITSQGSDANSNLTLFPKGTGIVLINQNTPVAYNATATLLIADMLSQIITTTSTTAVSLTLPTGTLTDAGISGGTSAVNTSFEWSIINTGSTLGAITLVAGTAHTIVGSTGIAISTSAIFKTRKTATNTYVTYRIS